MTETGQGDVLQGFLDLFQDVASTDEWRDLPEIYSKRRADLWASCRKGPSEAFLTRLKDLATGNWLPVLHRWESELASGRKRQRAVRVLATVAELARMTTNDRVKDQARRKRCLAALHCHRLSTLALARGAALVGLAQNGNRGVLSTCRNFVDGKGTEIRHMTNPDRAHLGCAMAFILRDLGSEDDWERMLKLLEDKDQGVRGIARECLPAFQARVGLDSGRVMSLLEELLESKVDETGEKSPSLDSAFIFVVRNHAPEKLREVFDGYLQAGAIKRLVEVVGVPELAPILEKATGQDHLEPIRVKALSSLGAVDGERAFRVIKRHRMLEHETDAMRQAALEICLQHPVPRELEVSILKCANEEDHQIKMGALNVLARTRTAVSQGELISQLSGGDSLFQDEARQLLVNTYGDEELGKSPDEALIGEEPWWAVRRRAAATFAWGEEVGSALLGRPVQVVPTARGLGWTVRSGRNGLVTVHVNDRPLTTRRKHGEDIVRGLILHEVAHHMYDFSDHGHRVVSPGQVGRLDLSELFNLICDERIERKLRSRHPGVGPLFDRLAAFAFLRGEESVSLKRLAKCLGMETEETGEKIQAGLLPGRLSRESRLDGDREVTLSGAELAGLPQFGSPYLQFAVLLRAGHPVRDWFSEKAKSALALVPPDLKDMNHHQIVDLCQRLGELLGKGSRLHGQVDRLRRMVQGRLSPQSASPLELLLDAGFRLPDLDQKRIEELCNRHLIRQAWREDLPPMRVRRVPMFQGNGAKAGRLVYNVGKKTDFPRLQRATWNSPGYEIAPPAGMGRLVRLLRRYLTAELAHELKEEYSWQGHRLDPAKVRALVGGSHHPCLVRERGGLAPRLELGVLIDRSGSMEGRGLERAVAFARLVGEAAKGVGGVSGFMAAFDHQCFWDLGCLARNRAAVLRSGGGNNDAGAMLEAAERMRGATAPHRALIMISDGLPTQCTVENLRQVVRDLEAEGIVCMQVAVAKLEEQCFRHNVELERYSLEVATARFGKMLRRLVSAAVA